MSITTASFTKTVRLDETFNLVPHEYGTISSITVAVLGVDPPEVAAPVIASPAWSTSHIFLIWSNHPVGGHCTVRLTITQAIDLAPLSSVFNVRDYGAVAGDTGNQSTAIQAAVTAATAAGGGVVYFPAGTYRCTAQIAGADGVYFLGDGYRTSKIHFVLNGSTDALVFYSAVQYGRAGGIEGLHLYVASQSDVRDLVKLTNWGSEFVIRNARIEAAGRYGVHALDGIATSLENVEIANCHTAGLYVGTAGASVATTVRCNGCYFSGTTHGPGADVAGIGIDFNNCIFESNGLTDLTSPGFRMRKGHVTMNGCYWEDNAGHEMDVGTESNSGVNHFGCFNPTIQAGPNNQTGYATVNCNYMNSGAIIGGNLGLRTKSVVFSANTSGVTLLSAINSNKTPEFDLAGSHDLTDYGGLASIIDGPSGNALLKGAFQIQSSTWAPTNIVAGVTTQFKGSPRTGWIKLTVPKDVWTTAATTQGLLLFYCPPKGKVKQCIVDTTEAFAGLAGTITLGLGTAVGGQNIIVDHDVKSAPVVKGLADADLGANLNRANAVVGGQIFSWTSSTGIYLSLKSGAGNIGNGTVTNLTNGTVDVYLELDRLDDV